MVVAECGAIVIVGDDNELTVAAPMSAPALVFAGLNTPNL